MASEIELLRDIKAGIWILVYLVGFAMFTFLVRNTTAAYKMLKADYQDAFYNAAYAKFENAQFNDLIDFCLKRLQKKPRDVNAYWFLAKANYEMKDFDKAKQYLQEVLELAPSWEKDYVAPLLARMDSASTSPTSKY